MWLLELFEPPKAQSMFVSRLNGKSIELRNIFTTPKAQKNWYLCLQTYKLQLLVEGKGDWNCAWLEY
jgi:hypothetical protein